MDLFTYIEKRFLLEGKGEAGQGMQLCHNSELNFFLEHCTSHACSQVCPRPSGEVNSPVSSVLTCQHAGKCALSGACIHSLAPLYLRGLGGKEVAGVETSFCLRDHYRA